MRASEKDLPAATIWNSDGIKQIYTCPFLRPPKDVILSLCSLHGSGSGAQFYWFRTSFGG